MNIKQIIKWSLQHWWWFAISVTVCMLLAVARFFTATPMYNVRASLMLRQISEKASSGPDELMQLMGSMSNKTASDEVKVLTSRDLLGRVVDELDLCTAYSKRVKCRWFEQFPNHDLTAKMDFTEPQMLRVNVYVRKDGYKVKVKRPLRLAETYRVKNLSQPFHTKAGDLTLSLCDTISKGHFRAVIIPRAPMVDILAMQIQVARLSRESNIITLSTTTPTPYRMVATINTLLNFYNNESTTDKNRLAVQTEQFLSNRIAVVEQELTNLEAEIESYKRTQQIANLSKSAENLQKMNDECSQQIAEIDAQLRVIEFVLAQLDDPNHSCSMIPGNMTEENELLEALIQDYNEHVSRRNALLQTATEENTMVVKENELIGMKRRSVKEGMEQNLQALKLKRQNLVDQQNLYTSRLASIPETERHYLEMNREKSTMEKQYIFLIEKREENAMLLSSETVPARIVESAQQSSSFVAPVLKKLLLMGLFFGLLLPLLVYFFDVFRKEYL